MKTLLIRALATKQTPEFLKSGSHGCRFDHCQNACEFPCLTLETAYRQSLTNVKNWNASVRDRGTDLHENVKSQSGTVAHEIAMNPVYLRSQGDAGALSTFVHELCHLWRHEFGPPNRGGGKGARGYHDLVWAGKRLEVGLIPTDTGLPDGKMTGYRVSHLIVEGGLFDIDCKELLASGFKINWHDRFFPVTDDETDEDIDDDTGDTPKPKKKKDRVKFTCDECGLNAWAKPSARLVCGSCGIPMTTG